MNKLPLDLFPGVYSDGVRCKIHPSGWVRAVMRSPVLSPASVTRRTEKITLDTLKPAP